MIRWLPLGFFAGITTLLIYPKAIVPPVCIAISIFICVMLFGLAIQPTVERKKDD